MMARRFVRHVSASRSHSLETDLSIIGGAAAVGFAAQKGWLGQGVKVGDQILSPVVVAGGVLGVLVPMLVKGKWGRYAHDAGLGALCSAAANLASGAAHQQPGVSGFGGW